MKHTLLLGSYWISAEKYLESTENSPPLLCLHRISAHFDPSFLRLPRSREPEKSQNHLYATHTSGEFADETLPMPFLRKLASVWPKWRATSAAVPVASIISLPGVCAKILGVSVPLQHDKRVGKCSKLFGHLDGIKHSVLLSYRLRQGPFGLHLSPARVSTPAKPRVVKDRRSKWP